MRMIKRKRGKDKDRQEGGLTFMITTAATVREVCMVEGDRARERVKMDNKGNREKRQAAAEDFPSPLVFQLLHIFKGHVTHQPQL